MSDNILLPTLGKLVDRYGLPAVVTCLAAICQHKATNVAQSWHNRRLARTWHENGRKLSYISETITA